MRGSVVIAGEGEDGGTGRQCPTTGRRSQLRDIDGLEVLERLRDLDPPPPCKVLIVSASLDEQVEQAARAAGAAGCVSKDLARADICATALSVARQ